MEPRRASLARCARLARRFAALAAALACLGAAAPAAAQTSGGATFGESVAVGYVLVPVVVRTKGGYINNLIQKDFRLFVDGKQVPIESFESGHDAPVSLVFLQDLSGSMGENGKLEGSREAVRYFLDQAKPGDEFAIATFAGDLVQVDVPFTADLSAPREDIARWEAYGTTALHDAVAWLPEIVLDRASLKRAAVLITDGVDNQSTIPPDQARELVRKAELPVYVLGLDAGSPYELGEDGKKLSRFADTLNLLASLSGGKYYPIGGPYELKEACAAIAEDLRHQYVLGFSTGGGAPSAYHTLRVEVGGKQRALSFRRSYRGPAPQPVGAATTVAPR